MRPGREAGFRPDGGCGFPSDPALEARDARYFWRPEIAPFVVVLLAPAPVVAPHALHLANLEGEPQLTTEGIYLRIKDGPQLLLVPGAEIAGRLSVILPLDDDFPIRLAAAETLHQLLTSGRPARDPLSRQRRQRLKRMLRALDGRAVGASYRDIAEHVLGETIANSSAWRTSPLREVAIRLGRGAVQLMRGGYMALLRKRR